MYRFIRKSRLNSRMTQERIMSAAKKNVVRNAEKNILRKKESLRINEAKKQEIDIVPEIKESSVLEQQYVETSNESGISAIQEEITESEVSQVVPKKNKKGKRQYASNSEPEQNILNANEGNTNQQIDVQQEISPDADENNDKKNDFTDGN